MVMPPLPPGMGPGGPPGMGPGGPPPPPIVPPLQFLSPDMFEMGMQHIGQAEERGPRRPPPTADEVKQRAQRAQDRWRERDKRMDEDYQLYTMVEARHRAKDDSGEKIVRNVIYTLCEKAANMIGAQMPVMKHEPARLDQREGAQRIENLERAAWAQWNRNWMMGLHTPLRRDMAHFIILRGWLAGRLMLSDENEGDELPADFTLADPRYVYPSIGANGRLRYVAYVYPSTVGEVLDEWPEAEGFYKDTDDNTTCKVTAYYDDWWHAVLVDGHEVKPATAHGYGFVPWVFAMANGAPVRATEGTSPSWESETGVSLFHSIKYPYRQQNRILSQLANEVARASDPPAVYWIDPATEEPTKLDLAPGATNYFLDSERFQFIETTPNPNNVAPLLEALEADIEKGGLPSVLWGGGGASNSGFAISLLSGAARDQLFGVISALEFAYEQVNRYMLTLIRDFHPGPVGFVVRDRYGNYVGAETVTAEEIAEVGINNRVKFRDLAPQDRFQQIQAAIALTDKNLVSLEYARDELIGVDNPEEENQRVLSELIYKDEDMLRDILTPHALYKHSPVLFKTWLAMQKFRKFEEAHQQAMQQQQQAMMMGGGGGPPGASPLPGTPPTMVPAPMGAQPFDALLQARASAGGGVGQQVPPGVSGIGGQIPGGMQPR